MKKCGLRKAYAAGGLLDSFNERQAGWDKNLDAGGAGSVGILEDPTDQANAEKTARWALQDKASKAYYDPRTRDSRGLSAGLNSYAQQFGNADGILEDVNQRLRQGFQNGGVPRKETTDELLARMRATYGGAPAAPAPEPAPAPVQAAPQPVAAKPQGFLGGIRAALDPERRMKAAGFENGGRPGVDDRGFIHGPKGVDKVPAKVADTGEDILVTAGERIVNKEQNAELEKLAAEKGMGLDEYLEATTGKPVGPKLKGGLRGANNGGYVDDFGNLKRPRGFQAGHKATVLAQQVANAAPSAQQAPTGQVVRSGFAAQQAPAQATQLQQTPMQAARAAGKLSPEAAAYQTAQASQSQPQQVAQQAKQPAGMGTKPARGLGLAAMALPVINTFRSDAPTFAGKLQEGFGGEAPLTKEQSANAQYARDNVDLPWWAGPNGAMVPSAKLAEVGERQKMRDTHEANLVDGPGKGKFEMPKIDKEAAKRNTQNALANADTNTVEGQKARNIVGAAQTSRTNGLDYATLEQGAKGGRSDFMGEKDATEYQLPEGMRGGFVTRSGNKDGLRKTTYLSGEASAADKARDAEFEAKGYGKDAYGNWMTPQRLADKQALSRIERERAEFNAFSDQVTDPNARAAGLRAMMLKYGPADKAAADAAKRQAEQALTIRGQDITLRGQDNMQRNSERDFNQKQSEGHYKRLDDILKAKATVDGKLDGNKYALLQQYAGNFKSDAKVGSEAYFKDLMANLEVDEKFRADDGSWFRSVRNQGTDPVRGLRQQDGLLWGSYYVDPATNRRVSASELSKMSPSAREALMARLQAQQ